ncbi:hypothetical protein [Anaeromyxobacter paludicola]|uniref:Uncharacterized protein n=1 Tax=Anaeromyxobacter paludicola TaxID=2918171 RepID=A0ABM7X8J8_9BACT|nr:hypothetical protein [Anaeromyxobacter paludicola]BDG08177.1 hypothetical protein AMPC_12900 [Anaeromyxobacter paludicola]
MARLDFANAKLGALRSRLWGRGELRELAVERGRERVEAATALLARAADEPRRILSWVEGRRQKALLLAWLALDDSRALRAALRAISRGLTEAEVRAAAGAPLTCAARELEPLLRAHDLPAAAAALRELSGFAGRATRPLKLPGKRAEHLLPLERALSQRAFAEAALAARRAGGEDGRVLAAAVADEADLANLAVLTEAVVAPAAAAPSSIALAPRFSRPLRVERRHARRAGAGGPVADLVPGGDLPVERLDSLAELPLAKRLPLLAALAERRFGAGAGAVVSGEPGERDRLRQELPLRRLHRAARAAPSSLAVPLAYLAAARAERGRVRLALAGPGPGLPAARLADLLEGAHG